MTFFGQGSDLLTDMPADSWLAFGQTDFGKLLDFYVDALRRRGRADAMSSSSSSAPPPASTSRRT